MELRVLQYFLAVAREQSISAAAHSLHLSQPTLSTQLKALEEEVGKQLLIRGSKGSRKVMLTQEGMILRKRAEEASYMMNGKVPLCHQLLLSGRGRPARHCLLAATDPAGRHGIRRGGRGTAH